MLLCCSARYPSEESVVCGKLKAPNVEGRKRSHLAADPPKPVHDANALRPLHDANTPTLVHDANAPTLVHVASDDDHRRQPGDKAVTATVFVIAHGTEKPSVSDLRLVTRRDDLRDQHQNRDQNRIPDAEPEIAIPSLGAARQIENTAGRQDPHKKALAAPHALPATATDARSLLHVTVSDPNAHTSNDRDRLVLLPSEAPVTLPRVQRGGLGAAQRPPIRAHPLPLGRTGIHAAPKATNPTTK